jgi:hypothetical protein
VNITVTFQERYLENVTMVLQHCGGEMKQQLTKIGTTILLHQNQPNPFEQSTKITFETHIPGVISLTVLNIMGHEVKTLVNEWKDTGKHTVEFDGDGFPDGQYFYRLNAEGFSETKSMLLKR